MELWKDIDGFPGYQVSNQGRVRSFYRCDGYGGGASYSYENNPKILSPTKVGPGGHLRVFLYKNGHRTPLLLHRLVAKAFIPNPTNHPIVRHLNDDPVDNYVENLSWGSQRDNVGDSVRSSRHNVDGLMRYNARRKTPILATDIRTGMSMAFESQCSAAEYHGISQGQLWNAIRNKSPVHGCRFEYMGGEADV